jgi:hypothetical protein
MPLILLEIASVIADLYLTNPRKFYLIMLGTVLVIVVGIYMLGIE